MKHRHIMTGNEQLANGEWPEVVLSPSYAVRASSHVALYRREHELIYASLMLCGKRDGRAACCPLLLFPAEFSLNNHCAFGVKTDQVRLNPEALEWLDVDADRLSYLVSQGELSDGHVGQLRRWLEEQGVNASRLMQWPQLCEAKELKAAASSGGMSVLPASSIAVVARGMGARGILDELEEMVELDVDEWSASLHALLDESSHGESGGDPVVDAHTDFLAIPAMLSRAQEKILTSARTNALTVCHGPPGTGKSFTIAAVAIDHAARGESVLVASQMDHAVDVVEEKIHQLLSAQGGTVRAGRKNYLKELKKFIEACLAGNGVSLIEDDTQVHRLKTEIKRDIKRLKNDEYDVMSEWRKALSRGELMADPDPNWLEKLHQLWVGRRISSRRLLMELSEYLHGEYKQLETKIASYQLLQRQHLLGKALRDRETRREFKQLLTALRRRRGSEQEEAFRELNLSPVLKALPIWLVRLSDLHRVLPLECEMFDVAIIDEASQCDLASVLPVLQRAKRVVIAGDTRQLRHLTFVSRNMQNQLADEYGLSAAQVESLDYRNVSLMDRATDQCGDFQQSGFLNEHFRSRADIIGFSNNKFYQNALRVMRDRPWEESEPDVVAIDCGGERDSQGVNRAEVDRLLFDLRKILDDGGMRSIGILSPFRNQVEAIRDAIQEEFSQQEQTEALNRHELLIGTAHTFQGEERDVMLISFCVDEQTNAAAWRFAEREDVFNVSVTRARNEQRIYHSLTAAACGGDGLISEYMRYVISLTDQSNNRDSSERDAFMNEVSKELNAAGLETLTHQKIAGVAVDLLVSHANDEGKNNAIGLDLIGYPGASYEAVDLHVAKVLRRAGFLLLPLGFAEWKIHRDVVVETVLRICSE